jgi:hypothetical protein
MMTKALNLNTHINYKEMSANGNIAPSLPIRNLQYVGFNIVSSAYGVYISQMIRYARACSPYNQFLSRGRLLTDKLMLQGFLQSRLMSAFSKFYGRYNDLIYNYKLSLSHMLSDIFHTYS